MIVDRIEHLGRYLSGDVVPLVEVFLASLGPGAADGKTVIRGEDAFAMTSSYETRPPATGRFEAHRRYIDIQLLLAGEEEIGWAPLEGLRHAAAYDEAADVAFFEHPGASYSRIALRPGICAVFFPEDAHMPQLAPAGSTAGGAVRKVVIKVAVGAVRER